MAFPDPEDTIVLTGTFTSPVSGTPATGKVVLTPSTRLVDSSDDRIYIGGGTVDLDTDGAFSVTLLRTDATGVEPAGWQWQIDEQPSGGTRTTYWIELTADLGPTVDLADIAPVSGPGGGPVSGVQSVNGQDGVVVLDAADVGADPAGSAAAAQAAATSAAATDATTKVSTHDTDTTSVHGIADTSELATATDVATAISDHSADTDPHEDRAYADGKLAKTSNLSDVADTSTARSNLGLGTSATRAVGTDAGTVAAGDDARFSGNLPLTGGTLTGPLVFEAEEGTDTAVETEAAGDTDPRYRLAADGAQSWGPGNGAADTFLYRGGAGALRTDGSLQAGTHLAASGQALGIATPAVHGFKAWTWDPVIANESTSNAADGTLYLAAVYPAESFTATAIHWYVSAGTANGAAGENHVGLYDASGNLLDSAGVDAGITAQGANTTTISADVTPGLYWVAFLFNVTTGNGPAMPRGSGLTGASTFVNSINQAVAVRRYAINGTGLTTLPSTINPASNVAASASSWWAAIA